MVDAPASPIATQKMASAATPAAELERQMMSWSEPKNEREWWALHEIERLRGRNAEVNMLAHGWMVAHGMLAAGKPYKLPTPADLPEVLSSAERRNEELVRIVNAQAADIAQHDKELEPPANIALRIANEHTDGDSVVGDRPLWLNRDGLVEAIIAAIAAERSSAERRNEELVNAAERHRDMLKQLLDEANARHFDAAMRADAAESALASLRAGAEDVNRAMITGAAMAVSEVEDRNALKQENRTLRATIASLTGQVGEMREALEKIADLGEHRAANAPTYARAAIATSPPGISTTGGDGGTRTSQL